MLLFCLFGGVLGIIGVIIYGANMDLAYVTSSYPYYHRAHTQWGFGLTTASCILGLICASLIAFSRVKHAAQTDQAMAAAGIYRPLSQPYAPGVTIPMQPMVAPLQPMQMPPGARAYAPAGCYPNMPAYPYPYSYPYPYPYPPRPVTPLAAPPMVPPPAAAPTPGSVTGTATQGLATSQVPTFYVMSQGQLVPVYSEMPTTTVASPVTTAATTEVTAVDSEK